MSQREQAQKLLVRAESDASYASQLLASEGWEWLAIVLRANLEKLERQLLAGSVKDDVEYRVLVAQRQQLAKILDLPQAYVSRFDNLRKVAEREQATTGTRR